MLGHAAPLELILANVALYFEDHEYGLSVGNYASTLTFLITPVIIQLVESTLSSLLPCVKLKSFSILPGYSASDAMAARK